MTLISRSIDIFTITSMNLMKLLQKSRLIDLISTYDRLMIDLRLKNKFFAPTGALGVKMLSVCVRDIMLKRVKKGPKVRALSEGLKKGPKERD